MKPSILFVASTCSHIRNFHLPYLCRYQELGWKVHVACGGEIVQLDGVDQVISLPFKKKMGAPENLKAATILRKLIQEEQYYVVSVHTSLAAFFTRLALFGMKERPSLVNVAHGYLFDDQTPRVKRNILLAAERLTAPKTDLLLTMNQWDLETARKWKLGNRIEKIPGIGVDFSRFETVTEQERISLRAKHQMSNNDFVLIYAAEFSKRKSQDVLIRAMQKLPERVVLVLAGEGALRQECMTLAQKLNVENRVIFPGQVQSMRDWYGMADAAVSASRSEGLPFNIMEAMYMKLPVVASQVKGNCDLIQDGETGLLYPYGDDAAFASQVLRLLDHPELCQILGEQAKRNVLQYGLNDVLPLVMDQYNTLAPAADLVEIG